MGKNIVTRIFIQWVNESEFSQDWSGTLSISEGDILKMKEYGRNTTIIENRRWESRIAKGEVGGIIFVAVSPMNATVNVATISGKFSFSINRLKQDRNINKLSNRVRVAMPDLDDGEADIEPKKVIVGKGLKFKITYVVGSKAIKQGGLIRILYPCKLFDWQLNETTVSSTNIQVKFKVTRLGWTRIGEFEDKGTFSGEEADIHEIRLLEGKLIKGDTVFINQRARKVQLFTNPRHPIRLAVDREGLGLFHSYPRPLYLNVANDKAVKFRIDVPSIVAIGEKISITIKALDKYNNLAVDYKGRVSMFVDGVSNDYNLSEGRREITNFVFSSLGIKRIEVSASKKTGRSNPIRVVKRDGAGYGIYWGELHAHTDMSDGYESPDFCFRYAKTVVGLDFCSTADHASMMSDHGWEKIQEATAKYNQPGRFVTFLGYEWGHGEQGDINVYYLDDYQPLYRGAVLYHFGDFELDMLLTRISKPRKLWEALKGKKVITIPHHIYLAITGDLSLGYDVWGGQDLEPLLEIFSEWGSSEYKGCPNAAGTKSIWVSPLCKKFGYKFMFQDALARGFKFGVSGGSDDHHTMPGNINTEAHKSIDLPCSAGLTAVYAKSLTRESIFEALKKRRTYATTGAKILLDFTINGYLMGEEAKIGRHHSETKERKVVVKIAGTTLIKKIEVVKNNRNVYTVYPKGKTVDFIWKDSTKIRKDTYYYLRASQKDGHVAWSSPIWFKLE